MWFDALRLRLWRVVAGPHPIWSAEGARLSGQPWTPPGTPAIYTGESFALCLVEVLVRADRLAPPSATRCVEAIAPDEVSREVFDPASHPGWNDPSEVSAAQAFGRAWLQEGRSALLSVPSAVTGGRDMNVVVKPSHADASVIAVGPETPATFDPRLLRR